MADKKKARKPFAGKKQAKTSQMAAGYDPKAAGQLYVTSKGGVTQRNFAELERVAKGSRAKRSVKRLHKLDYGYPKGKKVTRKA